MSRRCPDGHNGHLQSFSKSFSTGTTTTAGLQIQISQGDDNIFLRSAVDCRAIRRACCMFWTLRCNGVGAAPFLIQPKPALRGRVGQHSRVSYTEKSRRLNCVACMLPFPFVLGRPPIPATPLLYLVVFPGSATFAA